MTALNEQDAGLVERLTRPIIGIENRTAPEVFEIMCSRVRGSPLSFHISELEAENARLTKEFREAQQRFQEYHARTYRHLARLREERDGYRNDSNRYRKERNVALEARPETLLDQMAKHIGWELDWGEKNPSEEGGECGWRVNERRGNRNDREWWLIGFGDSPKEAIFAALGGSDHVS